MKSPSKKPKRNQWTYSRGKFLTVLFPFKLHLAYPSQKYTRLVGSWLYLTWHHELSLTTLPPWFSNPSDKRRTKNNSTTSTVYSRRDREIIFSKAFSNHNILLEQVVNAFNENNSNNRVEKGISDAPIACAVLCADEWLPSWHLYAVLSIIS